MARRNIYNQALNRVPSIPGGRHSGNVHYGEQMTAPGNLGFMAGMGQDFQGSGWDCWDEDCINYEDVTDLGSFINWWDQELGGGGLVGGEEDFFTWLQDQYSQQAEYGNQGSQYGGAGDIGFGNMFTGGGQSYDCEAQGPAYNSAGECIACCE